MSVLTLLELPLRLLCGELGNCCSCLVRVDAAAGTKKAADVERRGPLHVVFWRKT